MKIAPMDVLTIALASLSVVFVAVMAARAARRSNGAGAHANEATATIDRLRGDLAQSGERVSQLRVENAELQARMEAQGAQVRRERELYEATKREMDERFHELSAKALATNNEQFLMLASQQLDRHQHHAKGELEKRQLAIQQLVKPLGESLKGVELQFQKIERDRVGSYERLLESTTTTIASALRGPKSRGSWGELQLKRVVEMAGMVEHCDFARQVSVSGAEGRLQPDLVVHLAGGRDVVVDAKTPMDSYLAATASGDEAERTQLLAEHANRVRQHVKDLSRKEYSSQFETSPEFVLLFLPGEHLLGAALEADPTLMEFASRHRVVLATPTTLITMLWVAAHGWQEQALAENARAISAEGTNLYESAVKVAEHWAAVGKSLDGAVAHYNRSVGSMERTFLPKGRRLKGLRVKSEKEIAMLQPVDAAARRFVAPELAGVDEIEDVEVIEAPPLVVIGAAGEGA